jgi:hypothetical protein
MSFDLRVSALTFSGAPDSPVNVVDADVVVLIGPNNSGKSRALREIQIAVNGGVVGAVVVGAKTARTGTTEDLRTWLAGTTTPAPGADGSPGVVGVGSTGTLALEHAQVFWTNEVGLHQLGQFLVRLVDAGTRLALADSVPSIDVLRGQPVEPLQRLLSDHRAEERLSQAAQRAFGSEITVSRAGGSHLHLVMGRPEAEARVDNPTYLRQLEDLPLVCEQGDGIRSFIGVLLVLTATPFPVVLVDEPEAFLHPPQAREIGRQLASLGHQQRFIATHDVDVLLGLLDRAGAATIIRLRRDGSKNHAAVLDHEKIRKLWSDPGLRYSGLLDGLFHRGVVICEAEGDARLYGAALDAQRESAGHASSDLLFTHCGGKHRLPMAIDALSPLDVPVSAVADLDILRDEKLLERIVEALGGDWSSLVSDWRTTASAVESRPTAAPTVGDVLDQVLDTVGEDRTARLTEQHSRRIREITKSSDGWGLARSSGGLTAVPRGQAVEASRRLVSALRALGLFVVPVGELEGWARTIGAHGPKFVHQALDAGVHANNAELQAFVADIAAYLGEPVPPPTRS